MIDIDEVLLSSTPARILMRDKELHVTGRKTGI